MSSDDDMPKSPTSPSGNKPKSHGRKAKKDKIKTLQKLAEMRQLENTLDNMIFEAKKQMVTDAEQEVFRLKAQQEEIERALEITRADTERLLEELDEVRQMFYRYLDMVKQEEQSAEEREKAMIAARERSIQEALERQRALEEKKAKQLLELATQAREAEERHRNAISAVEKEVSERRRKLREERERREREREEEERKKREVARTEVSKLIQDIKEYEPGQDDREWIKKLNEHGANAKTLREKVNQKNPNVLSFREKMLKFTTANA